MNADLCRRLGQALGTHDVSPQDRRTVAEAATVAETWEDLPGPVQQLVTAIEQQPPSSSTPS